MTSHTTTASISSDRKTEAIDKKIEVLDTRVSDVEKDVTVQNTELRNALRISLEEGGEISKPTGLGFRHGDFETTCVTPDR